MLTNYFKIAWRSLRKNRSSTIINGIGLTIGISSCLVILIFVQYELSFDSYHEKADNTYRVVQHQKMPDQTLFWNTTAYPLAAALRTDFPELDLVTQTAGPVSREFTINKSGNELRFEESKILFADEFYPLVFDIEWLAGDQRTALSDPNSIVLTAELAEKYFEIKGEDYQTVLGQTIHLQNKDPLVIRGIVKNVPGNSTQRFSALIPYQFFKINNSFFSSNWSGNYQGTTFVSLNENSSRKAFETKIAGWKKKYLNPEDDARISYFLQPLKEVHTETKYGSSPGGYIMPTNILYMGSLVAFFILALAIANFVNLLTAQADSRSKEIGIRKVLGSKRKDLIFRFVFENSFLIAITLLFSILISKGLINWLNTHLVFIDLKLNLELNHIFLVLLVGIVTIVLAGIYPALVMSSFKPIQALKRKVQSSRRKTTSFRRTLVVFQFVIVQHFVIAAIIVASQMNLFKNISMGFSSDAVLVTPSPEFNKLDTYRNSLIANPEIVKVSFGSGPPMAVDGFQLGTRFRLPEQNVEEALEAEMKIGDVHYLDFYDLELLAGRNFTQNKEAFDEFVVNETLIKLYGWSPEEALGKRIAINEGEATIVGVVKDYHNNSLQAEITPAIILNWVFYQNQAFIKLADTSSLSIGFVQEAWENVFKNGVYRYRFLDSSIANEYRLEQLIYNGFIIFSILATSIGCLGLFGLMSFITSRRKKEIGIRKVLGASLLQNLMLFVREFVGLVFLAFLIAIPIVYFPMQTWLEGFTYRIGISGWMFLGGGFLTLLIALLTCSFQSAKASLANPVRALREE